MMDVMDEYANRRFCNQGKQPVQRCLGPKRCRYVIMLSVTDLPCTDTILALYHFPANTQREQKNELLSTFWVWTDNLIVALSRPLSAPHKVSHIKQIKSSFHHLFRTYVFWGRCKPE